MGGTNAGASLHGGHAFNGHGNIDDHAVTLFHTLGTQGIGDLAGFGQQTAVSDFGDFATVGFKNDGGFVAQAFFDIAVKAVVRRIQCAVFKPFEEWGIAFIKHLGERRFP